MSLLMVLRMFFFSFCVLLGVHVIGCFGVLWSFVFCFISGAEEGHARLPLQTPREKDFRMRPTGQPHANYVHGGTVADIL